MLSGSKIVRRVMTVFVPLALTLLLVSTVFAQTQITTGTIQGTVTDANGAVVPGANVEIKNLETNSSKTLTTDEDGRFVALALQPGNYSVTITKQGFATTVLERATLNVGQALAVRSRIRLRVPRVRRVAVKRVAGIAEMGERH